MCAKILTKTKRNLSIIIKCNLLEVRNAWGYSESRNAFVCRLDCAPSRRLHNHRLPITSRASGKPSKTNACPAQTRSQFQFQFREICRWASNSCGRFLREMHAIEPASSGLATTSYVPCVHYTTGQTSGTDFVERRVATLVAERTARRQFFYGIEVVALQSGQPTCLDFNRFLPILPTFVSIVWLGTEYCHVNPIDRVKSLQLARSLEARIPVLPHITAYCLSQERLDQFLALNFTNVLPIRGDLVHEIQNFTYSWEIVDYIRKQQGDNISICVAGYPEGYTSLPQRQDPAQAMRFLKQKIAAGADCIITQMCYRSETIIQFIKDCRSAGITVPIVVGLTVADCFRTYCMSEHIAGVHLPPEKREELLLIHKEPQRVAQFFVQLSLRIIRDVLDADVGVYGIQFYTFNKFEPIYELLKELRTLEILKD
ncbi:5,10-methylenetetrahydrofolate reductase [Drosophila subobscura]|uniref:5,10-methylenetetrahydrofolate reductase n=1 Tax=Drosophila subobscura TaxID=7241 RepID=UPI00155AA417|nr:5,10-methylenetetrahydrofolate reductase [Drosophila subobscura]